MALPNMKFNRDHSATYNNGEILKGRRGSIEPQTRVVHHGGTFGRAIFTVKSRAMPLGS